MLYITLAVVATALELHWQCLLKSRLFLSMELRILSYPSVLTFVLGVQKNRLIETVLLSTHNLC